MSNSPPTENLNIRTPSRLRQWVTRWAGEIGLSDSYSREPEHRTEEHRTEPSPSPEQIEFSQFNDEYDAVMLDEDGDPVSLSSSSVSRSRSWAAHQREEVERQTGMRLNDLGEEIEHDKFYKGSKKKKEIFFTEAMRKARMIQKRHPDRLLCGGLALNLYGVIKRERFSDLDFVVPEWRVVDGEVISMVSNLPYKHCLFLSAEVQEGKIIQGLKLQDLKQILYWKQRYNRDKDKEDLKDYLSKQFLKEEDFNL